MRRVRRPLLALAAVLIAVLLASGVAIAATYNGTSGDDTITGSDGADTISGEDGVDTLSGMGGNDTIEGGPRGDWIYGGDKAKTVTQGNDKIWGQRGDDKIEGGPGADQLYGNENNDTIRGLGGSDFIEGHTGDDRLFGADDAQTGSDAGNQTSTDGSDVIWGGEGTDTISGATGADWLYGGSGNDTISAGPLEETDVDHVYGKDGNDTIYVANLPASRDVVNCDIGTDKVVADSLDEVGSGCEEVERIQEEEPDLTDGTYQLTPDPSSECNVGQGSFTIGNHPETGERGVEVELGGQVSAEDSTIEACEVKIDYETPVSTQGEVSAQSTNTRKYTGTKPSQAEIDEATEEARNATGEPAPSSRTSGEVTTQSHWDVNNYYVTMRTYDPVNIKLTSTYHRLSWWYNGYSVDYYGRAGDCWAANPSSALTYWYTSYCRYPYSMWYGYDSSRSWIGNEIAAKYYNSNFLDLARYTYAYHTTRIWGYNNGSAGYRANHGRYGEAYYLLSYRIYRGFF